MFFKPVRHFENDTQFRIGRHGGGDARDCRQGRFIAGKDKFAGRRRAASTGTAEAGAITWAGGEGLSGSRDIVALVYHEVDVHLHRAAAPRPCRCTAKAQPQRR
ncbi:hypothetical protein GGD46_004674 [Rhizobium lusitanum]|uniref:Uncharacterized protein n=1 Tax=Rhizobium lusitanum TaxID=293958 RepID=A0A7X0MDY3_9HYPH|nr:hypothetical protein [Rhizobium lusitanum]MBB6487372.1 hypothetical protein [Rhizobium lusitanum]